MNIYIIDDDISVIKILENIIEDFDLGTLCGYSLSSNCRDEIQALKPDLVLIDLLMPEKDGIAVVNELKSINFHLKFIMISQVTAKDLIEKAYTAGVEFFMNKPINVIEAKTVISNVSEKIRYEETLKNIKNMFSKDININKPQEETNSTKIKQIQLVLNKLGMSGEKGATDIIQVCNYLIKNNLLMSQTSISDIASSNNINPKTMEQRMRRAILKGLSNIANLGIEDYMNETFTMYSSRLYSFEDVKTEMDFIRGKSAYQGKINTRKFIDGLLISIEE